LGKDGIAWGALIAALWFAAPATALAEGYLATDFGVRRVASRAVIAHADDGTAMTHNPACLLLTPGTTLYLGHTLALGEMGLRVYNEEGNLVPAKEITPDLWYQHLPYFMAASDFGVPWLRIGTTFHLARGRWIAFPSKELTAGSLINDVAWTLRWGTVAAFRISPKFNLGIGINLLHSRRNWSLAATPANSSLLPDGVGETLKREGSGTSYAFDLGLHFQPIEPLELGIVFQTGTLMELAGDVQGTEVTHETSFAIPFQLSAGARWSFAKRFAVAADLRMWHYQVQQEERSVYSDGRGEVGIPTNYMQSFAWSAGLSYVHSAWLELMIGYEQEFSGAQERTYRLDDPTHDGHTVGLGAKVVVLPGLELGVGVAQTWFELLDIQDSALSDPFNAKAHASMTEVTVDVQWTM
jgi:long-subunit fatty acid transport protein